MDLPGKPRGRLDTDEHTGIRMGIAYRHREEGTGISAMPPSACQPAQSRGSPPNALYTPGFLPPTDHFGIVLSQPYLIDSTEHGHKLAEDGSTNAGNMDKRALEERTVRHRCERCGGGRHAMLAE